jgi:hypothetical protein
MDSCSSPYSLISAEAVVSRHVGTEGPARSSIIFTVAGSETAARGFRLSVNFQPYFLKPLCYGDVGFRYLA